MADDTKCPKCGMFGGTHKKECRVLAYIKAIGLDKPKEEMVLPAVTKTNAGSNYLFVNMPLTPFQEVQVKDWINQAFDTLSFDHPFPNLQKIPENHSIVNQDHLTAMALLDRAYNYIQNLDADMTDDQEAVKICENIQTYFTDMGMEITDPEA